MNLNDETDNLTLFNNAIRAAADRYKCCYAGVSFSLEERNLVETISNVPFKLTRMLYEHGIKTIDEKLSEGSNEREFEVK